MRPVVHRQASNLSQVRAVARRERRRRAPAALHGDSLVPFLIAGALFGLLVALGGPADGIDLQAAVAEQLASNP